MAKAKDKSLKPFSIVVLISGSGSNLQTIIDGVANGSINANISAVISNKLDAYGLKRARLAGISTAALAHTDFASRDDFDQALMQTIDEYSPDLVVLAGFMRLLGDDFVHHYMGRMLNIHPSLLPKYRGLNTHQRALDAGDAEHGATVHFVIPDLDNGPMIMQAVVPVLANDNAKSLAERVLKQEHIIYPLVVSWFAEGRLKLENDQLLLDENPLLEPVLINSPLINK